MPTLLTVPSLLVPEKPAEIRFTLTQSSSNFVRVWVTSAPAGSAFDTRLKEKSAGRILLFEGASARVNGSRVATMRHTFDAGGVYTLVAQEYVLGAASYGGGYQDSPDSAPSETQVGAEESTALYVGQRLTVPIGAPPDTATLVLWVWNDTIRETQIAFQGEITPAIIDPLTPRARGASIAAGVTTALANLIDVTTTLAIGSIPAIVSNLRSSTAGHMANAGAHANADSVNGLPASQGDIPRASDGLRDFVNAALDSLRKHFGNEADPADGPPVGFGSGNFHIVSSVLHADRVNMPLFQSVSGQADAYAALADLWRCFEAHRVSLTHHTAVDSFNVLMALPRLLVVHREFLSVLASLNPDVPPGQSSGANQLIQQAGFSE